MSSKNMCKFVTETPEEAIIIHNFVLESDINTMKNMQTLISHRMILVKEGSAVILIDNARYVVSSGSIIFGFENENISALPDEKCQYMYISFSSNRANSLFLRFGINRNNRVFNGFDGIIPLWHEALTHATEKNIDLTAEGVLLYTFSRFTKDASQKNGLINEVLSITEDEFTDPKLSISEISNRLSYNAKYISHLFKSKLGVTYSEYLRNMRIKYAVSLLEHGIDSVKNVAFLSGFSDPLYFSNVFKKVVGVSPKEYKQKTEKL